MNIQYENTVPAQLMGQSAGGAQRPARWLPRLMLATLAVVGLLLAAHFISR